MAIARRQIIRPPIAAPASDFQRQRRLQRLRAHTDEQRTALGRWQTRLRRAFNAVAKHQKSIIRLERQIARTEES